MATYLLTWNPKRWQWKDLEAAVEEIAEKGFYLRNWSTGVSKKIQRGDRLFLIRLGQEPKGIIGSGHAESTVFEGIHWDSRRRAAGRYAKYVSVRFDKLLNPELNRDDALPRKELNGLGKMHWDSQGSGIQIPDDVARRLEDAWADFLLNPRQLLPTAEPSAIEGLRTEIATYVRGRSRQLRDLALKQSSGVCCVCGVNYSRLLGGKGVCVLQVHHREQLAAAIAPRVTHLSDLAVVCANCHMLIHMNPKRALSVEALKDMLSKSPATPHE
jgi:5-methylcytosine-specific restriction enzyme A